MAIESAISLRDVKKSFDGGHEFVLKGINLEIPKGSLTAIIGFSGTDSEDFSLFWFFLSCIGKKDAALSGLNG